MAEELFNALEAAAMGIDVQVAQTGLSRVGQTDNVSSYPAP